MAGKKTKVDNIVFDSELEANHYIYLRDNNINIIERQPQYELFPTFEYFDISKNKMAKYRKMVYTPDFLISIPGIVKNIAVEVKGFKRSDYQMRKKLFIMKYHKDIYFIESTSTKELDLFINNIKRCKLQ